VSIDREHIRALIAEYSALGRTGTATTNATTTQLIDTSALLTYASDVPVGSIAQCYHDDGDAHAAPEEEPRWVTDFDKATGIATLSAATTAAITAGDLYELWEPVVEDLERVNEAISRALTKDCFYIKRLPLGMLADGDCQAVTGWTANGSATRAVAALAYPYWLDQYYLAVTSSNGTDYVYQNVLAEEDSVWHIAVLMRTAAGTTGSVEIYDNANSATITPTGDTLSLTGETSAGSGWQLLKAQFTVPTDCDNFGVRLKNGTASGVTHFAFVQAWPANARTLPIPTETSLDNVWRILRGREKLDIDYPFSWEMTPYMHAWPTRGYGGLAVEFDTTVGSAGPFFAEIKTHYAALTDDDAGDATSDTDCPDDYIGYMASKQLALSVARRQRLVSGVEEAAPYEALAMEMMHEAGKQERRVVGEPPTYTIVRNRRV